MRRLLVIADGFPPMGGSGVQRTTKFVKYLPEFGWRACVLTGDPERDGFPWIDRTLLSEIPESTEVVRVPYWNPAERVFGRRWKQGGGVPALSTPTESPPPGRAGFVRRAVRGLRRSLLAPVGDKHFYWARRARRPAMKLARRTGAEAVYATASPYTSLLLGLWLKKRTGLPLVVDFRDPWTRFDPSRAHGFFFRVNRFFERRVLRGADRIICNHEPMRLDFERIEPSCRGRCTVLPNGFDASDFAGVSPVDPGRSLTHVGFAWEDTPQPVLRALAALKARGALPPAFRVRFIGGLPASSLRMIENLGLEELVRVEPRVEHALAIAAMRSAACLLLLLVRSEAGRKWYPGKMFEYMAAGRPILCVAPSGIAADLVREADCGLALEPGDTAGIERAIEELARDPEVWTARHYAPRQEVIERFDRRRLTERLAAVLDDIAEQKGESKA